MDVSDEAMRVAFKAAFKEMAAKHPLYGQATGLHSPNEWWTGVIEKSLELAGVAPSTLSSVMPTLAPSLLARFSTDKAYTLAEGVPHIFALLDDLTNVAGGQQQQQQQLRCNLATNSDSRILSVCQSLGLGQHLDLQCQEEHGQQDYQPPRPDKPAAADTTHHSSAPCLSYFLGYEKPHRCFFHLAVQRAFAASSPTSSDLAKLCAQTLYVGDDFHEDYMGATNAGLQAVWLKRSQPWPSGLSDDDKKHIIALDSLEHLPAVIRQSWSP